MKKNLLILLLAVGISCPAFAAVNQDAINNKKADVQQKFDSKKDKENQVYDKRVADAKTQYANEPDKLNNELQKLQIDHNRTMDKLNNEETTKLQKLDEKLTTNS